MVLSIEHSMDFKGECMQQQVTSQTTKAPETLEERIKESYKGLGDTIKEFQNGNIIQINNSHSHRYLQPICYDDIHTLTKDSPPHLLKALYFCEDYTFLDSNRNPSLTESNITKTFGYKSSFYLSFIANKDSLSNEYLEARKALYKTYQQIKQEQTEELQKQQQELEQELQGLDSKQRESRLQEIQRKQERELREEQREKERQEQRQARFSKNLANTYNTSTTQNLSTNNAYITKDSYLVLESNDTKIIFLDSLKHTYTNFTSNANTSFVNPKAYANNHDSISLNFSNKDILCRV